MKTILILTTALTLMTTAAAQSGTTGSAAAAASSTSSLQSSQGRVQLDAATQTQLTAALKAGRSVQFLDAQNRLVAHAELNAQGVAQIMTDGSARFEQAARVTVSGAGSAGKQSFTLVARASTSAVLMVQSGSQQGMNHTVSLASVLGASLHGAADTMAGSMNGTSGQVSGSVTGGVSGSNGTSGDGSAATSASGSTSVGVSVGGVSVNVGGTTGVGIGVGTGHK